MSSISVFIKNMAGDMTLLEVPIGTKVEDMPARLTNMDRELYPLHYTRVFRLEEEEEKETDTLLKEQDILSVLILEQPETGVFPQGGTYRGMPYARFVLQVGDTTIYLYGIAWDGGCSPFLIQTLFSISLSPELKNPIAFDSQGLCLYDTIQVVIPDITPSQMKNIYDVVHPYYEKLGHLHSYNPREPVECEGGSVVMRSSMTAHKKTKKHNTLMKSN